MRRQWQALNAAARDRPDAVARVLVLSGDPAELAAVTNPLVEREWLTGRELTAAGSRALADLMVEGPGATPQDHGGHLHRGVPGHRRRVARNLV